MKLCDECGQMKLVEDLKPVIFYYEDCAEAGWMCSECWTLLKRWITYGVSSVA